MGSEASPVDLVNVAAANNDGGDVSIISAAPKPLGIGSTSLSELNNMRLKGTSKINAISVENYCKSMENRDFALAIMASLFPKSSKRRPKRKSFIDLSREIEEYPDHGVNNNDVQILDSFPFKNRKPFLQQTGISNFEPGQSSNSQANPFMCEICAELKPSKESFPIKGCTHSYCSDCIHKYVASKLQDNITQIQCPVSGCAGLLEPEHCRSILPPQVFDRWGDALCEAVILSAHKFYCPYKDCSALLINDTGMIITLSECPICRRYFCAQCNVPWHLGIECGEFQSLNKDERENEDIMLMQLAKFNKWMRCPKCRFYVEKSQGCMFMRCRCGYNFCYNCGAPLVSHSCPNCKQ